MKTDELLKHHVDWLEQAMKRRPFEKVDGSSANFTEVERKRRIDDLQMRISDLKSRREETAKSYDRAIAGEEAELKLLESEKPLPEVQPDSSGPNTGKPDKLQSAKERKAKKQG